jgi:hypothetical protein
LWSAGSDANDHHKAKLSASHAGGVSKSCAAGPTALNLRGRPSHGRPVEAVVNADNRCVPFVLYDAGTELAYAEYTCDAIADYL